MKRRLYIAAAAILVFAAVILLPQSQALAGSSAAQSPAGGGGTQKAMGLVPTTSPGDAPRAYAEADQPLSLPAAVDLTDGRLPVGNQGGQNSCVAWSTVYYYKTYQEGHDHGWDVSRNDRQFSPAFVYNQISGGSDRGGSFPSALNCMVNSGAVDLALAPYNDRDCASQPNSTQLEAAKPFRAASYGYLWVGSRGQDISALKAHLAAGDPVVIGIPVYSNFYNCQGDWVGAPSAGDGKIGDHGLCAVGYSDGAGGGQGGIKIVNSWGAGWGAGGYTYLSYDFVSRYCWEAWVMTDRGHDAPSVQSINPTHGHTGANVTISGDNFGAQRSAASVTFNHVAAPVLSWTNNTIVASVPRGAQDGAVSVANYVGEAGIGPSFHVELSLDGASPSPARPGERVTIYGAGLGTQKGQVTMGGAVMPVVSWSNSEIVFSAPATQCNGNLAVSVGGRASNTVPFSVANSVWYLAEGSTGDGFETWILVQNPNSKPVHVNLTYMTPGGAVAGPSQTLPPDSRSSYNVAQVVPGQYEVSTRVTADAPVVAERAMYGNARAWGHDSIGVMTAATQWYLAEGSTANGFESWILVQNPTDMVATVNLTYMTDSGEVAGPTATLQPHSRRSFSAGGTVPGREQVSTRVTSDRPVVAERAVYWGDRKGGTDSIGVTRSMPQWFLAEGSTAEGFETWVLVQNPGNAPAHVSLTYMTPSGKHQGPAATVQPRTRVTFNVGAALPGEASVSTEVSSDNPVIAERAVYWGNRIEGHDSIGANAACKVWYLAEGSTGKGFETWVLVQNPNDAAAKVTLTYMTATGAVPGPAVELPANSRRSFNVADAVPGQYEVSTRVSADRPVIAERAVYGDGRRWGTDSIGDPW